VPIRLVLFAVLLPTSLAAQTLAVAFPEEHRVLLFDGRTYDSVASVPVGQAPHEISATVDGRYLYVGNTGATGEPKRYTITRIDVAEPTRTTALDPGDCVGLHGLQVSRSGKLLWVGCARARVVAEIELATGKVRRRLPIAPDGGWTLAATPDERRVFVAHLEGQAVSVIDRESGTASVVPRPGPQYGIDVLPGGREVWVTSADSSRFSVFDGASDRVLATVPSGGDGPGRLRFTPDGRLAVIPHDVSNTLTIVDVASRKPVATVPLSAEPKVLALSPDGRLAAVSHPDAKTVSIVDLGRRAVVRTIALPGTPDGVAYVAVESEGPLRAQTGGTDPGP
jgi:DNA-binding beta-propeller fold protein YncE